jgi:hypothetical protein
MSKLLATTVIFNAAQLAQPFAAPPNVPVPEED